jgi:hypothetical protein
LCGLHRLARGVLSVINFNDSLLMPNHYFGAFLLFLPLFVFSKSSMPGLAQGVTDPGVYYTFRFCSLQSIPLLGG